MAKIITYKYRIKDRSAHKALARHAVAINQVWNWCNAFQQDIEHRYRAGAPKRKWPTHFDLQKLTRGVGAELGIHQQSVGDVCQQFTISRDRDKTALRFRSSFGAGRSRGWIPFRGQSRQISGNSVWYLGKRYRFFGAKRRPLPDNARGGHFVEDVRGRWYVCFYIDVADRHLCGDAAVGIDLGVKSFAALSDGRKIAAPQFYRRHEQKLGMAHRAGNKRRAKAIHAKIKNCRHDFLHKVSTDLAARYALIAVGNVNAKHLAQTRMAKSAYDTGWGAFRFMLRYKSPGYVEVDERFTTQTCSCCGSVSSDTRPKGIAGLGIREWQCSDCGASHDRDVNSALNILAIARRSAAPPVEESRMAA